MDLNQLSDSVYQVIQDKGHHDVAITPLVALTYRQLSHLHIEKCEARAQWWDNLINKPGAFQQMIEELADIIIVALDLCGIQQVDLSNVPIEEFPIGMMDEMWHEMDAKIGVLENTYRKSGCVDQDAMSRVITLAAFIMRRHGSDPIEEVEKKMRINASRPARYGLAA
jgi:hypothetical protein